MATYLRDIHYILSLADNGPLSSLFLSACLCPCLYLSLSLSFSRPPRHFHVSLSPCLSSARIYFLHPSAACLQICFHVRICLSLCKSVSLYACLSVSFHAIFSDQIFLR